MSIHRPSREDDDDMGDRLVDLTYDGTCAEPTDSAPDDAPGLGLS